MNASLWLRSAQCLQENEIHHQVCGMFDMALSMRWCGPLVKRTLPGEDHPMKTKPVQLFMPLLAVPLSILCMVPSCTTELPEPVVDEDWTLEEEADIFEDDSDVEPDEPDDVILEPDDEPGSPFALVSGYSCPPCDVINCASSTYDRRDAFGKRPINANTHMYGGTGNDRGLIKSTGVFINCGIRKKLDIDGGSTVPALYVWNAVVADPQSADGTANLSGWIPESALQQKIKMKTRNNPQRRFNHKVYRFAGPGVAADLDKKYNTPGKYFKLRIAQHGGVDDNLLAHYLTRKDSLGNWAVNVTQGIPGQGNGPGHANDTYTISSDPTKNPRPTGTSPSSLHLGETTTKKVKLYTAKATDASPSVAWTGCGKSACYATFMYVKVRGRYGWMPKALLTKKVIGIAASVPPDGGPLPCGSDGAYCCAGGGCDLGLVCNGTTCVGCGAVGEACCPGDGCVDGLCSAGMCVNCGATGEACCAGGACDQGVCNGSVCVGCGNAGEVCCGGACATDRLNCSGTCQPCGDPKQPCCASGAQCNAAGNACYGGTCGAGCYARCVDGSLQGPYPAADNNDCLGWSDAACAGHNGKGRVELNQVSIYDNGNCGDPGEMCCAADKCKTNYTCQAGPAQFWKWCQ